MIPRYNHDKIREELYGDESIQRDHVKVFQIMERRALDAARMGKSIIYDATDLSARRRKHMVRQMSAQGCSTECVICVATFEVCCERQLTRKRKVPTEVIHRQYCSFEIPNDINILEINYGETTSINYYFKVEDIDELNL